MTVKEKTVPSKDFTLLFFSEEASREDLQVALRKKWKWIVLPQRQNAFWYTTLINNLQQSDSFPEVTSIEHIRQVIENGIKRSAFERLKLLTRLSSSDLVDAVRIPARTLSRRKVFHPDESERILRVAAAFQRAIEVFEDLDKARHWFNTPKSFFSDRTPLQFCDTDVGASEVQNLLGRIEHGVFS